MNKFWIYSRFCWTRGLAWRRHNYKFTMWLWVMVRHSQLLVVYSRARHQVRRIVRLLLEWLIWQLRVFAVFVHPPIDLSFGEDERGLLLVLHLVRTDRSTDPPLLLPLLREALAVRLPSGPLHHILRRGRHIHHHFLLMSRHHNLLCRCLPFVLLRGLRPPRERLECSHEIWRLWLRTFRWKVLMFRVPFRLCDRKPH